jgi:hypothetical protein
MPDNQHYEKEMRALSERQSKKYWERAKEDTVQADKMREAFGAWCASHSFTTSQTENVWAAWQAAVAIGMERAAGICDDMSIDSAIGSAEEQSALACANAIRAKIKEA